MISETDERLLRLRDVKQKSGLGTSTIYRRIADGTFPAPRALARSESPYPGRLTLPRVL